MTVKNRHLGIDWIRTGFEGAPDIGGYKVFSTRLRYGDKLEASPEQVVAGPAFIDVIQMPNGALVIERR